MDSFKDFLSEGNPLANHVFRHRTGNINTSTHAVHITAFSDKAEPWQNKKNMSEFRNTLREKGYGFVKVKGVWQGGSEPSVRVMAKGPGVKHGARLHNDMMRLAGKYNQDSILYDNGVRGQLVGTNDSGFPGKGKTGKGKPKSVGKAQYNPKKMGGGLTSFKSSANLQFGHKKT